MHINANKNVCMTTKKKSTLLLVRDQRRIIDNVHEDKYLGILITSNISWNMHIDELNKKGTNRIVVDTKATKICIARY